MRYRVASKKCRDVLVLIKLSREQIKMAPYDKFISFLDRLSPFDINICLICLKYRFIDWAALSKRSLPKLRRIVDLAKELTPDRPIAANAIFFNNLKSKNA